MHLGQDLRFALRLIRQHRWFSAAIVATIGIGIGANTTIFTLVNTILFKPLPFPSGNRLVLAGANQPSQGREFFSVSYADVAEVRASTAASLERVEAFSYSDFTVSEKAVPPERVNGSVVTPGLFEMIEARPILGRSFTSADEKAGADRVLLLGHALWRQRYGGAASVLGTTVRLNGQAATIIGVMPSGFRFPDNQDAWTVGVANADTMRRDNRSFLILGRLREGVGVAAAQSELDAVARRLEREFPESHKGHGLTVSGFHDTMTRGHIRIALALMLGAVGFVLLIACANAANLMLARATGRSREISIRTAIGATRRRVLAQLLTESVVLSLLGGLAGLGLARAGVDLVDMATANIGRPYWFDFSFDWRVALYLTGVVLVSGVTFGILPAIRASRVNLNDALKDGARGTEGGRGSLLSSALVVLQFTVAAVLLMGAGLMLRSFWNASADYANIPARRILKADISLPAARYPTADSRLRFVESFEQGVASLPGVERVAFASHLPGGGSAEWQVEADGHEAARSNVVIATPAYLAAIHHRLTQGRTFFRDDGSPGKESVVVTQAFVNRFFAGGSALGKQVRLWDGSPQRARVRATIIGVVPDLRQDSTHIPSSTPAPVVFVPYRMEPGAAMAMVVETRNDAASIAQAVRAELQRVDEDLTLSGVQPLDSFLAEGRWFMRLFGTLFSVFAAVAMLMAALGIYAVMAYSASRRTREIGIRVALGADRGAILREVIARGLWQLGIGMAGGMAAALAAARLMSALLFRVSPGDPLVVGMVAATLVCAGAAACFVPAVRAARMDAVAALRWE